MSSVELQPGKAIQSLRAGVLAAPGRQAHVYSLVLIILTIALYYPVKSHPFVNYDDNVYVTENLQVQSGLSWDTVSWAFVSYDAGNWHPLTWLSHALDVQLYDMNPAGHHQTSLLLHLANAWLLFWVLQRATGFAGRSFMVAALFTVHPINVESVVWISERKNLLSMLFFLLALGAYRWYVSKPGVGRYAAVALMFALGLMAKPQIITLPFVLLLWDYWPLQRMSFASDPKAVAGEGAAFPVKTFRALVEEKLPLLAIAAASAAMTMKAQRAGGAVGSFGMYPLSVRLSNAIVSYVRYLAKAVWPAHLAPMYPHPGGSLRAWQVYGALAILIVVSMWVVERRRQRYLLVGWLWFVGTLIPMIGLVQVGRQAMADRYAYLPLLGIFIMVCWAAADWFAENHLPAAALPIVSVVVLSAFTLTARRQIGYWADNVTLWTHTIAVTGPNYVAQDDLGGALMERKQLEEAIPHFREAAEIHPVDPISNFNIAYYAQQHGNLQEAIEGYQKAIVLTTSPGLKIKAWNNMGLAYRALGDDEQARACFATAKNLQGP
ncbi:MAG: tetratricopeptide repeat protein [Candidatus Korobacteraceae bacterium]